MPLEDEGTEGRGEGEVYIAVVLVSLLVVAVVGEVLRLVGVLVVCRVKIRVIHLLKHVRRGVGEGEDGHDGAIDDPGRSRRAGEGGGGDGDATLRLCERNKTHGGGNGERDFGELHFERGEKYLLTVDETDADGREGRERRGGGFKVICRIYVNGPRRCDLCLKK